MDIYQEHTTRIVKFLPKYKSRNPSGWKKNKICTPKTLRNDILEELKKRKLEVPTQIEKFENLSGLGVKAIVNGKQVLVGTARLMKESNVDLTSLQEKISACKSVEELLILYKSQTPHVQQQFTGLFTKKRSELTVTAPNEVKHISHYLKPNQNGNIGNTTS